MDSTDTDNERESSKPAKTPRGKGRKAAKVAAGKSRSRGKSGNKPATTRNKAAAADKPGRSDKSTGKKTAQSAGKKSAGKAAAAKPKKAATRTKTAGKPASRGRKASGKSGTAGDLPIPDPPPVELPPVPETAADDPRSLSWMAAQALSALNAVKANQAEKGKLIMARAEKDNLSGEQQTSPLDNMPGAPMPPVPRQDAAATAAAGEAVSGKAPGDDLPPPEAAEVAEGAVADAAVRVDTPDRVPQTETVAGSPVAQSAATRPAPVAPPAPVRRTLFSPQRLVAAVAILGVVAIGVWYGGGEDVVDRPGIDDRSLVVETQPVAPDVAGSPADVSAAGHTAQEADPVAGHDAGSGWTPAMPQFSQPEPQTAAAQTEANPQTGSDDAAPADREAVPSATAADTAPPPAAAAPDPVPAETAPAAPRTPGPAPAAPHYGYYPPQMGWRQPPYYRPAYARPPAH